MIANLCFAFAGSKWLVTLLVAVLPVELETVSGEIIGGTWHGTTPNGVQIERGGSFQEVAYDQLVGLRPLDPPPPPTSPSRRIALIDGSKINALKIESNGDDLVVDPRRQAALSVPLDRVHWVRFRKGTSKTDAQWLGLTEAQQRRDVMVIRRDGDQLDPVEGVVVGLLPDRVNFNLDGTAIDPPIDRLEGVILRTTTERQAKASARVTDVYGSTFEVESLRGTAEEIEMVFAGGISHSIALKQVAAITWASGQLLLSELKPADSAMQPYLQTQLDGRVFDKWFGPRAEATDIAMVSGGEVDYRIEDGFQTLAGSVRRETLADGGKVTVQISIDANIVWKETLSGDSAKGFEVTVAGHRRVKLKVLAGEDGDVGDQVRFLKPRFLK